MLLMIDNYDSFTFNLVQEFGKLGAEFQVYRNDQVTVAELAAMPLKALVVSPGPCSPTEAGISVEAIQHFSGKLPLFGVCLGHQSIIQAMGGTIVHAGRIMHGKTSPIHHDGRTIFAGLSNPFTATRYHSLVILKNTFDETRFEVSAWTDEGEIMGLRAKPGALPGGDAPLEGVQFHPESFLTVEGPHMLANFLGLPAPSTTSV